MTLDEQDSKADLLHLRRKFLADKELEVHHFDHQYNRLAASSAPACMGMDASECGPWSISIDGILWSALVSLSHKTTGAMEETVFSVHFKPGSDEVLSTFCSAATREKLA